MKDSRYSGKPQGIILLNNGTEIFVTQENNELGTGLK